MQTITRDQLNKDLAASKDFKLVDALPANDFKKGHLPHALSIPADKARELAPQLLKDKDQMIVTYCGNEKCPKSKQLAETLESLGYNHVMAYEGGKEDWQKAGLPLETSGAETTPEGTYGDGKIKKMPGSNRLQAEKLGQGRDTIQDNDVPVSKETKKTIEQEKVWETEGGFDDTTVRH